MWETRAFATLQKGERSPYSGVQRRSLGTLGTLCYFVWLAALNFIVRKKVFSLYNERIFSQQLSRNFLGKKADTFPGCLLQKVHKINTVIRQVALTAPG